MQLLYLQSENRRKDIHFYINSPGGSVTATLAIYDTMQILSCPVATYCVGLAASGGAVLLAGGSQGQTVRLAQLQGHDPPALRRRRRPGQRHRDSGGTKSSRRANMLNEILSESHRSADRESRQGYRSRLLYECRRGQGVRRRRRHADQTRSGGG
jgi:hypothetical protein